MTKHLDAGAESRVTAGDREKARGHRGCVVWLTGLSGSGKTTIAFDLEEALHAAGAATVVIDGDLLRKGLCSDLGFTDADRHENVRRAGEIARILADAGLIAIVALISPLERSRRAAKRIVGAKRFIEVHVATPFRVCRNRDAKGLYRLAKTGKVKQMTGLASAYEPPVAPSLRLDTARVSRDVCVSRILDVMRKRRLLKANS